MRKKRPNKFWLVLPIALFILLIVFNTGPQEIVVDNVKEGAVTTFELVNKHNKAADCYIVLSDSKQNIGIIPPKSQKNVIATSEPISVECTWTDMDIEGCDGTTIELCERTKVDSRLRQCIGRELHAQYFCAALITKNASLCTKIYKEPYRSHCYAYNLKKPEYCSKVPESDWCYMDLAMNWGRSDLCEQINEADRRNACLAVATQDVEMCKQVSESNRFSCIVQLAEMFKDTSLCETLTDKDRCYEELEWIG